MLQVVRIAFKNHSRITSDHFINFSNLNNIFFSQTTIFSIFFTCNLVYTYIGQIQRSTLCIERSIQKWAIFPEGKCHHKGGGVQTCCGSDTSKGLIPQGLEHRELRVLLLLWSFLPPQSLAKAAIQQRLSIYPTRRFCPIQYHKSYLP